MGAQLDVLLVCQVLAGFLIARFLLEPVHSAVAFLSKALHIFEAGRCGVNYVFTSLSSIISTRALACAAARFASALPSPRSACQVG
jgi:hypothetical protein